MNITYVIAVVALLVAVVGYFLGIVDGTVALQTIFASLSVFGIRKAVANSGRPSVGGFHF